MIKEKSSSTKNGGLKNFEASINKLSGVSFWVSNSSEFKNGIRYMDNIFNLTGYTGEQLDTLPLKHYSLIDKDESIFIQRHLDNFFEENIQDELELHYSFVNKNGTKIFIKENIYVNRAAEGEVSFYNASLIDVTAYKEKEEQLALSANEAKRLNEAKDNFISILSHDLRSPFTSILGFAEILMNENTLEPKDRLEYLHFIYDSSLNQLQLINNLLDWSRLSTGRLKLQHQRLHAKTIVYNCISTLTGAAMRKNIEIKVDVSDSLFIQGDERHLSIAISNLLSNGIKYSQEGSRIDVSAALFNNDMAELVIKDKGIGISETNQLKLFKIDKMFSTAGTRNEKGTGIGLILTKEIIDKHKGDIWFYSQKGEGSEFHITIPCSSNCILIVEENQKDRIHYSDIVKKYYPAFNVVEAQNGYEALELVLSKFPTLILANHSAPLMNGVQLTESVRKSIKNYKLPVIIFADTSAEELKSQYERLGVSDILDKPVNKKVLAEKIKSALN